MKTEPSIIDHFTDTAKDYDAKNQQLAPIADTMHFLIRLILQNAPTQARVLCAGVGTGAEILSLAQSFPEWTFVGVDPSKGMLDVCKEKLANANILNRCEFIQGYVQDVPVGENFDVVLSILVAHFVKKNDRVQFYQAMYNRLRTNGILINTELSFDLSSKEFPLMLQNWKTVQSLMGATPKSLSNLSEQLQEKLTIISPVETESLLNKSGINIPIRFFQAFMICGWFSIKNSEFD